MAKLTRITASVFGESAGSTQIGVFGSLAAGSPQFTNNPVTAQSLSNWSDGWFAATLGGNSPAIEDLNAVDFVNSYQIAYALQSGIPEYDGSTPYYQYSFASFNGVLYQSTGSAANTGNTPSGSSSFWSQYLQGSNIAPLSITNSQIADSTILGSQKIANGTITQSLLAPMGSGSTVGIGGIAISQMGSPSFSTTGTSYLGIPGLSVTITTSGRPLFIGLQPYDKTSSIDSYVAMDVNNLTAAQYNGYLAVDNSTLATEAVVWEYFVDTISRGTTSDICYHPLSLSAVVPIPAGTYSFQVSAKVADSNCTIMVGGALLTVYEI